MSHVLVLIADPARADLHDSIAAAVRAAVGADAATWLAPGIACEFAINGDPQGAAEAARKGLGGAPVDVAVVPTAHRRKRLLVADIAPVAYPPRNHPIAAALAAIPLAPGMTRTDADAALASTVDDPGLRGFLLQNLIVGATPHWRIGLGEITAALRDLEGWDHPGDRVYAGPTLFVAGDRSDFIRPEHRSLIRGLFPAARFVTVKNAGHWLHADNPAAFVDVVQGFLARWETA